MTYIKPNLHHWNGRIDSTTNYDAFRWHQWVRPLDLSEPVELPKDTLKIGFIGFECDEGIKLNKGREGAALGPKMIRKELSNLPCLFTQDLVLFECGNIQVTNESLDELQRELADQIDIMIRLGVFPIVLGGGHELALGHYKGLKKNYPDLGIINLDAHLDMRPYEESASSGTMFRQIADLNRSDNDPFKYLCLGVQKRGNTIDLLKKAKELEAEFVYARDIIHGNINDTHEKITKFARKSNHIYLTLCTDVISSAYAPGVSSAQPLGIHPEIILDLIKYAIRTDKLVAFDVAEVSPRFDQDNVTANLACTFIFAFVNELADLNNLSISI
jgi:formiminoglutamase